MKNNFLYLVSAVILFSSCASDKVMSDSWIQKRKYNKGFYFAKKNTPVRAAITERKIRVKEIVPQEKLPVLSPTMANPMAMNLKTKVETRSKFKKVKTSSCLSTEINTDFQKNGRKTQAKSNKPSPAYINPAIYAISFLLMVLIAFYIPTMSIGLTTSWSATPFYFSDYMLVSYVLLSLLYGVFVILFS